jgi:hypothetical protein
LNPFKIQGRFQFEILREFEDSPIRKVVPSEFIYPMEKFGNFWRTRSTTFGIFKLELVEILKKEIF